MLTNIFLFSRTFTENDLFLQETATKHFMKRTQELKSIYDTLKHKGDLNYGYFRNMH